MNIGAVIDCCPAGDVCGVRSRLQGFLFNQNTDNKNRHEAQQNIFYMCLVGVVHLKDSRNAFTLVGDRQEDEESPEVLQLHIVEPGADVAASTLTCECVLACPALRKTLLQQT